MNYWRGLRWALSDLCIRLGLALLAWGWRDVPAFFAQPARLLFVVVVAIQAFAAGYLVARTPATNAPGEYFGLGHWRRIAMETILVLSVFGDHRELVVMPAYAALRYIGLGLYLCGIIWSFWVALCRQQSAGQPGIIPTAGPFRYIRHPRYLGTLAFGLGMALLFRSWAGLALNLLLLIFIVMRIREEEAYARREFGPNWALYSRRSWRLIPFIF